MRRKNTALFVRFAACLLAVMTSIAKAGDVVEIDKGVDASVEQALAFLVSKQQADGSIHDGPNRVAMTGLSVLAFLAAGNTPDDGRYGQVVSKAIDYLVKAVPPDGYIGRIDNSRMYGHGIVALALAEAGGVETDTRRKKDLRDALGRMLRVILDAQKVNKDSNNAGGWRYEPTSGDSDLSLSGWCALALRASQNSGMNVEKEPVDRAVSYVARCFKSDAGAFAYQPGSGPTISMTAVAILNLFLLDAGDREEVRRAADWLSKQPVQSNTPFFHYSIYYSMQAATQIGGDLQTRTLKNSVALLLPRQQPDGGFSASPSGEEPGRIYATAMSVLTLAVPYEVLPIYQK